MHSSEPARKKVKLVTGVNSLQSTTKSLVQPVDLAPRDFSAVADTGDLAETSAGAVAAVEPPQSFTVFVLDSQTRLFVTGELLLQVTLLCGLLPTCEASFGCTTSILTP